MAEDRINQKFNYNETYYEEVDKLYREWRRSVWDDSLGSVPQSDPNQIGPGGWLEVLDSNGTPIVEIDGDGMTWAHAATHENGGSDEISVAGLSGLLADAQTPLAHAASHAENAADELLAEALGTASVDTTQFLRADGTGGLVMATPTGIVPAAHAASHEDLGSDEIDVTGLSGLLADAQTPLGHAVSHEDSGSDELDVTTLGGFPGGGTTFLRDDGTFASPGTGVTDHGALTGLSDDDHPQYATNTEFDDHSARHENGGADEISLAGLDGTPTELTNHLSDATDAHDASAISVLDTAGNFTGTDVEAVLAELQDNIDGVSGGSLTDHTHETTGSGADGGGSTLKPTLIDMPTSGEIEIRDMEITSSGSGVLNIAINLGGAAATQLLVGTASGSGDNIQVGPASGAYASLTKEGISIGNGGAADVTLTRTGASNLSLGSGDNLNLSGGGNIVITDAGSISLASGNITMSGGHISVGAGGNITSTSGAIIATTGAVQGASIQIGSNKVARYVSIAPNQWLSSTTSSSITPTLTSVPDLGAGAVAAQIFIYCSSTTVNAGNSVRAWDGNDSTKIQGIVWNGGVANLLNSVMCTVPVDSLGRIYYSVARAAGTVTYTFNVVGYWTTA